MAVSSSQSKSLRTQANLISLFMTQYPSLHFKKGHDFAWSPKTNTITYIEDAAGNSENIYALIHEVAHADLGHNTFSDDFNLLQHEVSAWERAKDIGASLGVDIDEDHIQDCLDTYRDWLHARAKCPTCGVVSLQASSGTYSCFNCKTVWKVPKSQLCRVSRRVITKK